MISIELASSCLNSIDFSSLRQIQQSDDKFRSPFLSIDYFKNVCSVIPTTELAIIKDKSQTMGYFFFERVNGTAAIPCGRQLCDYQAVVLPSANRVSANRLLKLCRLQRFNYDHLICLETVGFGGRKFADVSPTIEVPDGANTYWTAMEKTGSRLPAEIATKRRRLSRDVGRIECHTEFTPGVLLDTLIKWKSEQYKNTGVFDLFSLDWPRQILERLIANREGAMYATTTVLTSGGTPVAGVLGLRLGRVWHWWFPAYDPSFARYSPGTILLAELLDSLTKTGVTEIDMGGGLSLFKARFSNGRVAIAAGSHIRPMMSLRLSAQRAISKVNNWIRST